jgi:branched-chain amino acid transport system permease protein
MGGSWLQFVAGGLTAGAIYALVALGFSIVYHASHAINFAQGEFVMIGGMSAVSLVALGLPLWAAVPLAVAGTVIVGVLVQRLALEPAQAGGQADVVTLIIITIGVALFLRGLAQLVWDKRIHPLPAFSGGDPIALGAATILPQSLWVLGGAALAVLALGWFFNRTLTGKAMRATAINPLAARLMGISTRAVMRLSFALAAALGALGGVLTAPITFTSYDVGVMLGLKGFAAAMLGGLGSFGGAVAGGLLLGLIEGLGAGFLSSAYKDAIAFVVILAVLFFLPGGLAGARHAERV